MAKRWLVVGGGFRGIVGAYLLASADHDVVLIDNVQSSSDLGGDTILRIVERFLSG